MEAYESDFVPKIRGLIQGGPDFAALVKESLLETMGEAGSTVLLAGMDEATLEHPARFARELSKFFGTGAASILHVVLIRASERSKSPGEVGSGETLASLIAGGPDSRLGTPGVRQRNYLHDQRMKDDLEEYKERMAISNSGRG